MPNERDLKQLLEKLQENKKGLTQLEITKALGWSQKNKKSNREVLGTWEEQGHLTRIKGSRYVLATNAGFLRGTLDVVKDRFAFVDTAEFSVFVPRSKFNGAFSGDTVLVKVLKDGDDGKKKEGEVIKVLKRESNRVIGIFEKSQNFGFVIPTHSFGKDIFIPKKHLSRARNGELVVAEITNWGGKDKKPEGKIVENLGDPNNTDVMIDAVIQREGLSEVFPFEALKELRNIDEVSEDDIRERKDLRDLDIITIDGDDAKDLDDAVYVEKLSNGNYKLIVSIADVSHYVKEKSELDKEAFKRGNSVYLVDRVIPMFPKELSNGTCSLNPHEDKLTFTCEMEVDNTGKVVDHDVYKSIINTTERMTYSNVNKILNGDEELTERYSHIKDMIFTMYELSQIISDVKYKRGSIDFDLPEIKVVLGEDNKVEYLKVRDRGSSEKIIEDFMILANETVAEKIFWMEVPSIYRTHDKPDPDRLERLNESLAKFDYRLYNLEELHPGKFQKIIEDSKERDINMIIHKLILMSLKQARYTKDNTGHFGLASAYYTHFTSPIRRYADLMVHRILNDLVKAYPSKKRLKYLNDNLDEIGLHISKTERKAMKIEEETVRIKVVEFMMDKIGEEYKARITGMNRNGIFIETEEHVECYFNVIQAAGYYEFDDRNYTMRDVDTSREFNIGERLEVVITRVDLRELEIEVIPSELLKF